MSLLRCAGCTTEYAVGLPVCPQCGSAENEPIGGPSYLTGADPTPDPAPRKAAAKAPSGPAKPPPG